MPVVHAFDSSDGRKVVSQNQSIDLLATYQRGRLGTLGTPNLKSQKM
jgi:hypothetical protein